MPHIVKYLEKRQCIKPKLEPWQEDLKLKYTPIAEQAAIEYLYGNKTKAFQIIEDVINDILPKAADEWFDKLVDIKKLDDYINF